MADQAAIIDALQEQYPGSIVGTVSEVVRAVQRTVKTLLHYTRDNTVPAISACPDELNRDFDRAVNEAFGPHFTLGGLAGFPFVGNAGFNAYSHHLTDEGKNMVIFSTSHVGVSVEVKFGNIVRDGMGKQTTSCGSGIGAYQAEKPDKSVPQTNSPSSGDCSCDDTPPQGHQQDVIQDIVHRNISSIHVEDDESKSIANLSGVIARACGVETANLIKTSTSNFNAVHVNGIIVNTPPGKEDLFVVLGVQHHPSSSCDHTKSHDILDKVKENMS